MAIAVITKAAGGLPVVDVTATKPGLGMPVTEVTNGYGIAVTKVVGKPGLPVTFVAAESAPSGTISHGSQLTTEATGPGALAISSFEVMTVPGRGYWRDDTPAEFSLATNYTYNNSAANKGGVVPAGGLTIDGYSVPAGTIVVQARDFSAGSFAMTSTPNYLFRGCRFRGPSAAIGYFNCGVGHTGYLRLHYNDFGGLSSSAGDFHSVPVDIKVASGLVVYRNRIQFTTTGIQWNIAAPVDIIENFISDLTTFGTDAHLNGIMCNGGETNCRILRNNVVIRSPDTSGRDVNQTDCIGFFQDFGELPGNGTNIGGSTGYVVDSNYVGGTGYCFYAGQNPGAPTTSVSNLKLTNNLVTTSIYNPTGGFNGPIAAEPPWNVRSNAATNNKWADGPNAGQLAFDGGAGPPPVTGVPLQKNGGSVNLNASIVTSLPGATTAGNTILIFANGAATISTPAGFTSRSPQVNNQGLYLFEKLVASGNATDTPTLTMAGAYNSTWQIAEYSGVTGFGTSSGNTSAFVGGASIATPAITPTSGNRLLVAFMGVTANSSTNTFAAGDPQSWTNSFTGQQSNTRTGGAGTGNDSMVGGWAARAVTASGSTSYSTAATFTPTGNGAPATIIAAYAVT